MCFAVCWSACAPSPGAHCVTRAARCTLFQSPRASGSRLPSTARPHCKPSGRPARHTTGRRQRCGGSGPIVWSSARTGRFGAATEQQLQTATDFCHALNAAGLCPRVVQIRCAVQACNGMIKRTAGLLNWLADGAAPWQDAALEFRSSTETVSLDAVRPPVVALSRSACERLRWCDFLIAVDVSQRFPMLRNFIVGTPHSALPTEPEEALPSLTDLHFVQTKDLLQNPEQARALAFRVHRCAAPCAVARFCDGGRSLQSPGDTSRRRGRPSPGRWRPPGGGSFRLRLCMGRCKRGRAERERWMTAPVPRNNNACRG